MITKGSAVKVARFIVYLSCAAFLCVSFKDRTEVQIFMMWFIIFTLNGNVSDIKNKSGG